MINKPRGTEDLYGEKYEKYSFLKTTMERVGEKFGFTGIITPVFESAELFVRTVGEDTDIVQKEMYTFEDKSHRLMSLRPEGTAGVMRAYIENGIFNDGAPTKFMYFIPMYRYEKVQKGRQREFNQFGVELIQSPYPIADFEVIRLGLNMLEELGLEKDKLRLKINSIGCVTCRNEYKEKLKEYVEENISGYCSDCQRRKETNILRVLDCKIQSCQTLNADAPTILEYLCDDCKDHFDQLIMYLEDADLEYEIDPTIVRGLDYYNRTVFEILDENGQAVLGGGRYDGLSEVLGGRETPAVGFAAGIERLMQIVELPEDWKNRTDFVIVSNQSDENKMKTNQLAQMLREKNYTVEVDLLNRSFNAQMKHANRLKAKVALIIGEEEISKNELIIRDMDSGEERREKFETFFETLS